MIVVPFIEDHLRIDVIEEMSFIEPYLKDENYANMLSDSDAYTGIVDGEIMVCAGLIKIFDHRYSAWALVGKNSGKYMLQITREVLKHFKSYEGKRIEIDVQEKFPQAHRWAEMLGFKNETPQGRELYGIDGENYYLYARY